MVMACLSGDVAYLVSEHEQLAEWFDYSQASSEELEVIYEVSLEAAMEGRVTCLETMHNIGIPMHGLCPIIAACHGHKNVISFCESISLGNCNEAWGRYFNWAISQQNPQSEETTLVLATEWVTAYRTAITA